MSSYEVRCLSCDVTFPMGTKRCLHCGSRIGAPARVEPDLAQSLLGQEAVMEGADSERGPSVEDGEEEPGRRSILRAGVSVVWLIVIVVGMLARLCVEEG